MCLKSFDIFGSVDSNFTRGPQRAERYLVRNYRTVFPQYSTMEERQQVWLTDLPNEILTAVFDNLGRFHLNQLTLVNKRISSLSKYLLEHRKKIRLCGENLRVLILTLPSDYDKLILSSPENEKMEWLVSRTAQLVPTFFKESPTLKPEFGYTNIIQARERVTCQTVENGVKSTQITLIESPMKHQYRLKLYALATTADLCTLVVDPKEIGAHDEDIQELVFGCCFMMSARNVIVAIDLSRYPIDLSSTKLQQKFNRAKDKISILLNRTVGPCYIIIPINLRTGTNITSNIMPKYEWFSGSSLKKLVLDDQLRTNFDESEYEELCKAPFRLQLTNIHKIGGIGTVPEGRVISGTLKPGDQVVFHPFGRTTEVKQIESNHTQVNIAKPGDVIGASVVNISKRDYAAKYTYLVKLRETKTINCTIAFRAQIAVMKPDRFAQRQVYKVFYGSACIPCMVWWIFPTEETSQKSRKFKLERPKILTKPPNENNQRVHEHWIKMLKDKYMKGVQEEKENFAKLHRERGSGFKRPPRKHRKKVTAILLPFIHYGIEPYKQSQFEKNHTGKLMIMEKRSIVGVGRVDCVISNSEKTFKVLKRADYERQFCQVVLEAGSLFTLPKEQKLLEQFLEYAKNSEHTKPPIHKEKGPSYYERRMSTLMSSHAW